ncbi:hypothetical protein KL930_003200 [Ogataea haglerorum]|uniref:CS domain-containing protein n=1 Tax=Ogataea haglerorum TaxID=1937702 RepID=A0AAN6D359_9ASCO|nr:uncharacterized protein KL911_002549 [Ogataea haglerorum]KAG7696173.1 hypothetical protein KL915_002537 [Ogataea haglerorum]KAG7696545.1 hypothetical protein KL951_003001 [Ogataea haglerorum]KAG7707011.1 hypothetical protein KL914_002895 [Ogataea haglerorum]KAG7708682.1 hypothetical protein KL950_002202 [Ogataea haglerorum]KAG7725839.1 hypothetical protein KL933_003887 [Ogataea haglerorum]
MSTIPPEEKNLLYLTINVADVEKPEITLTASELKFEGKSGDRHYKLDIEFFDEIDDKKSKYQITGSHIFFVLYKKKLNAEFWPRLTKSKVKQHYIKTDFDKWVDEDEQDEKDDDDLQNSMGDLGNAFGDESIDFAKLAAESGGDFPSLNTPSDLDQLSSSDEEEGPASDDKAQEQPSEEK